MTADPKWWTFWRGEKQRWICAYRDNEGKLRQKVVPVEKAPTERDERAAERWAAVNVPLLLAQQTAPIQATPAAPPPPAPPPVPPPKTLRELAPEWLALAKKDPNVAPATYTEYASHLELSILPAVGESQALADLPAEAIDVPRLRAWLRGLRNQGLSPQTIRNRLSSLTKFLAVIRAEGWAKLEVNVARDEAVRAELPPLPHRRVSIITLADFAALIRCDRVPAVRRIRYLLAALAGLSDGEIAGLRLCDIRLTRGEEILNIEVAVAIVGPEGYATEKGPKNNYRIRTIPMHPVLAEALRWWIAEGWEIHVCRTPEPEDRLIPAANGEASRPKSASLLKADLRRAGVVRPKGFTFHKLRACFATWLEDAGASDACRARLLGHRGATTAARHYTAAVLAADREAISRIVCLPFVPPIVPTGGARHKTSENQSHLRDLNSRPTVYENPPRVVGRAFGMGRFCKDYGSLRLVRRGHGRTGLDTRFGRDLAWGGAHVREDGARTDLLAQAREEVSLANPGRTEQISHGRSVRESSPTRRIGHAGRTHTP
jgi:integrase